MKNLKNGKHGTEKLAEGRGFSGQYPLFENLVEGFKFLKSYIGKEKVGKLYIKSGFGRIYKLEEIPVPFSVSSSGFVYGGIKR